MTLKPDKTDTAILQRSATNEKRMSDNKNGGGTGLF